MRLKQMRRNFETAMYLARATGASRCSVIRWCRGARSTPNFEAGIVARFARAHAVAPKALRKRAEPGNEGRISCFFASTDTQDNTINRLLLMSNSEHHLPMVPIPSASGAWVRSVDRLLLLPTEVLVRSH